MCIIIILLKYIFFICNCSMEDHFETTTATDTVIKDEIVILEETNLTVSAIQC
jgi:hypothetical protein